MASITSRRREYDTLFSFYHERRYWQEKNLLIGWVSARALHHTPQTSRLRWILLFHTCEVIQIHPLPSLSLSTFRLSSSLLLLPLAFSLNSSPYQGVILLTLKLPPVSHLILTSLLLLPFCFPLSTSFLLPWLSFYSCRCNGCVELRSEAKITLHPLTERHVEKVFLFLVSWSSLGQSRGPSD